MNLILHAAENIYILEISDRFDSCVAAMINKWVEEQSAQRPIHLIIDLSKVTFIDADGLAALERSQRYCRQQQGDLYVCTAQQSLRASLMKQPIDEELKVFIKENETLQTLLN